MKRPGRQRDVRGLGSKAKASRRLMFGTLAAYSRTVISSNPAVCSITWARRTGSVSSQGLANSMSPTRSRRRSSKCSLPSSWSFSTANATKLLEIEPARNIVSGVTCLPVARSAKPIPAVHNTLSLETRTTPAPGVSDSCNTLVIACSSSSTVAGAGGSTFFGSAQPKARSGVAASKSNGLIFGRERVCTTAHLHE